jgi:MFS family permease
MERDLADRRPLTGPYPAMVSGDDAEPLGGAFRWLWTAETVSMVGTTVTTVALPALAVLRLHAGPAEVGLLAAAGRLPFPVLGLIAGVAADRLPRRTVMVISDLARVLILGAVPLADAMGGVSVGFLIAVALVSGGFGAFFDICNLAYVPSVVGRRGLVRGYSWIEIGYSLASLVGPGLGGVLVQAFGAARAIAADSVSFLVSALCLAAIRPPRRGPAQRDTGDGGGADAATISAEPVPDRASPLVELREGVRFVMHEPVLRALLITQGVLILGAHSIEAPIILLAYNVLHLSPGTYGALLSIAGAGALLAAVASRRAARWRPGRSLIVTSLLLAGCTLAVPLATITAPLLILGVLLVIDAAAGTLGNVVQVTLRQSLTPSRLRGRMNALFRVVYWGAWPLANVLGGLLAAAVGPVAAIVAGGAVCVGACVLMTASPLRNAVRG